MSAGRCAECGDPTPRGFTCCLKCHAWNDLYVALFGGAGLDEFRLRRARRYLARGHHRESVRALLVKLQHRVDELEYEMDLR